MRTVRVFTHINNIHIFYRWRNRKRTVVQIILAVYIYDVFQTRSNCVCLVVAAGFDDTCRSQCDFIILYILRTDVVYTFKYNYYSCTWFTGMISNVAYDISKVILYTTSRRVNDNSWVRHSQWAGAGRWRRSSFFLGTPKFKEDNFFLHI